MTPVTLHSEPGHAVPVSVDAIPVLVDVLPVLVDAIPVLGDAIPVLVDVLPVLVDSLPAGSAACSGRGWKLVLFLDCTGR